MRLIRVLLPLLVVFSCAALAHADVYPGDSSWGTKGCGRSIPVASLSFSFTVHTDSSGNFIADPFNDPGTPDECFANMGTQPWTSLQVSVASDVLVPNGIEGMPDNGCTNETNDFAGGLALFSNCISPVPPYPGGIATWIFFGGPGVPVFVPCIGKPDIGPRDDVPCGPGFGEIAFDLFHFKPDTDVTFDVTANVPEPGSFILMFSGLGAAWAGRRRGRRK